MKKPRKQARHYRRMARKCGEVYLSYIVNRSGRKAYMTSAMKEALELRLATVAEVSETLTDAGFTYHGSSNFMDLSDILPFKPS